MERLYSGASFGSHKTENVNFIEKNVRFRYSENKSFRLKVCAQRTESQMLGDTYGISILKAARASKIHNDILKNIISVLILTKEIYCFFH